MPASQDVTAAVTQGTLAEFHPCLSRHRDTGNGYHVSARAYKSGDVEMTAIKLNAEDSLRRGGGAKRKNKDKEAMNPVVLQKSIARARVAVRRRCMAMNVDRLLTLTFRENITDIDEAWKCFHYFVKQMRWQYEERFQYVVVPEYQKRGAVHFHLAIKGFYPVKTVRSFWHAAVGKRGGNIDITDPKNYSKNSWNPKHIGNYIAKYITKTESTEFNRKRYASGGKIELPVPIFGWLALGVPVVGVMCKAMSGLTDKPVYEIWETEEYFHIIKVTT